MTKHTVPPTSSNHRRRSSSPLSVPMPVSSLGLPLCVISILGSLLVATNLRLIRPINSCSEFPSSVITMPSSLFFNTLHSPRPSFYHSSSDIREWGCQRNETPTIFVHLAKAGGGGNRARFAAAALNYDRSKWYVPEEDSHYYPIPNPNSYGTGPQYRRGKFCNSINNNFVVPSGSNETTEPFFIDRTNNMRRTFEGSLPCNATTPLGMAVACPQHSSRTCMGCDLRSEYCDTVYVGHNHLGSELHWLPPRYLKNWWEENYVNSATSQSLQEGIEQTWTRLGSTANDAIWCRDGNITHKGRPTSQKRLKNDDDPSFQQCIRTVTAEADSQFEQFWPNADYSPMYASMPLQRTTMLRDPWAWIGSKFFWHELDKDKHGLACDNQEHFEQWIPWVVKEYMIPLCGVDCENRWERGVMTFEEMAVQAEGNLRNSFSVVGLLNETDTFYEMVSARIGYIDMMNNAEVKGKNHQSTGQDENNMMRCKALFKSKEFQETAKQKHPELNLMERIFEVGVEVNRFQLQELSRCPK